MTVKRRALYATLVSLAVWSAWVLIHPTRHPWNDLARGQYTDHFSHAEAARLFPRVGLKLISQPLTSLFSKLSDAEVQALPHDEQSLRDGGLYVDAYQVPGWQRPAIMSWGKFPRPYPPGDLVLFSPAALLRHYTSLSFSTVNRLTILLLVLYAHLAVFLLFELLLVEPRRLLLFGLLFYGELIHWTLNGFYDAAAAAPLLLCARFLDGRRLPPLLLAFCAAGFIHLRAYFYAPWLVWAVVVAVRERQWRSWSRRDLGLVVAAAVLGVLSLDAFALSFRWLRTVVALNPARLSIHNLPNAANLVLVAALAALLLVRARAWLDVAMVLWTGFMSARLKQVYPWHALLLWPWLAAPATTVTVDAVRLFWVLFLSAYVFGAVPLPTWLHDLF